MKKVVLGISKFLGGIISIAGVIIAAAIYRLMAGWFGNLSFAGIETLFIIFALLAALGLVISIIGDCESEEINEQP